MCYIIFQLKWETGILPLLFTILFRIVNLTVNYIIIQAQVHIRNFTLLIVSHKIPSSSDSFAHNQITYFVVCVLLTFIAGILVSIAGGCQRHPRERCWWLLSIVVVVGGDWSLCGCACWPQTTSAQQWQLKYMYLL